MSQPILKLTNISKTYPDGAQTNTVLHDVSFEIQTGEFAAIVGPSGTGKSTLLTIMGALLHPTSGTITLAGQELTRLSAKAHTTVRLNQIGFIFQSAELIPYLTVQDQLTLIQRLAGHVDLPKAQAILTDLGLAHHLQHYPKILSGGEKQRVVIARSLINEPPLILADEPTASLDAQRGREVVASIKAAVHQQNRAAVMVTHDERVLDLVDHVWQISDGTLTQIR